MESRSKISFLASVKRFIGFFLSNEGSLDMFSVHFIEMEEFSLSPLPGKMTITIHTSRPDLIIGKAGERIDRLKKMMQEDYEMEVSINLEEFHPFE